MANLQLAVKAEYFDAMVSGEKIEEYRLYNEYWCARLTCKHMEGSPRKYERLIITKGYPCKDDKSRRIDIPYRGYEVKRISHPHFGIHPVDVFAIRVNLSEGVK